VELLKQNLIMENYYSRIIFGENDADSSEQNTNEPSSEDGATVGSGVFSQVVDQYFQDHQATDVSTISEENATDMIDSIPTVNLDNVMDYLVNPVDYLFNWSEEQNITSGPEAEDATTQPQEDASEHNAGGLESLDDTTDNASVEHVVEDTSEVDERVLDEEEDAADVDAILEILALPSSLEEDKEDDVVNEESTEVEVTAEDPLEIEAVQHVDQEPLAQGQVAGRIFQSPRELAAEQKHRSRMQRGRSIQRSLDIRRYPNTDDGSLASSSKRKRSVSSSSNLDQRTSQPPKMRRPDVGTTTSDRITRSQSRAAAQPRRSSRLAERRPSSRQPQAGGLKHPARKF